MRILLSNDDSIYAPGILAMYDALQDGHSVSVVAPETVQSAGSHAITIRNPVFWHEVNIENRMQGVAVGGTPADCIKLAVNDLLPEKPQLVVSGINAGLNTGIHVLYSGTVAAAIEGAVFGSPAVAVSLQYTSEMDFQKAGKIARQLIDQIIKNNPKPGQVFNINIPEIKAGYPKGLRLAPQSPLPMLERIEKRTDPSGRYYYWLAGDFTNLGDEADTDRHALREGYVCITPLQFDLTNRVLLDEMQEWSLSDSD